MIAALPLTGCGEGGDGLNVRLAPAERPDIDAARAARGTVRLPEDERFNYTSNRSGQDGADARGESAILERGAIASARVAGEGSAWGEFQLGYAFDNVAARPLQAIITLNAAVRESAGKTLGDAEAADATGELSLTFFVKDSVGLVLREESLALSDLTKGARTAANRHELVFDVLCEPDRGYYVILAGRAAAQAAGDGSLAESKLELSDVSMQIQWQPVDPAATRPAPAASSAPAGP